MTPTARLAHHARKLHPSLWFHHAWGPLLADAVSLTVTPVRRWWERATETKAERARRRLL